MIFRAMLVLMVLAAMAPDPADALALEQLVCPVKEDWSGEPDECPCQRIWKPAPEQLERIQEAHRRWLAQEGWEDPAVAGRAILCKASLQGADLQGTDFKRANLQGADLRRAKLQGAKLFKADLRGTSLWRADLQGANLVSANLQGADLKGANLQDTRLHGADLQGADLKGANLLKAYLKGAWLKEVDLQGANLQGHDLEGTNLIEADLRRTQLQGANLVSALLQGAHLELANLQGADLGHAELQEANLRDANLQGADLQGALLQGAHLELANLQGADLGHANLQGAGLEHANLQGADLEHAKLQEARLIGANVEKTRLAFARIDGAIYAPNSPPPDGYLPGIRGLAAVEFPAGEQIGMVQLRELIQKAGLRELEREATYAIEHVKTFHARQSGSLGEQLSGWLQLIVFEWTTGWGLYPGRALLIMLGLIVGMAVVYTVPIATPSAVASGRHGIFRIWPRERLEPGKAGMTAADDIRVDRLTAGMPTVFAWAFYFSALSAFHFGWRELNVGIWLTRMQFTEFALRGRGWVRFTSGLQSLISVYLLAMWVLTYFGRPFQ